MDENDIESIKEWNDHGGDVILTSDREGTGGVRIKLNYGQTDHWTRDRELVLIYLSVNTGTGSVGISPQMAREIARSLIRTSLLVEEVIAYTEGT